ncbi:MAG: long-chain fatty acid--CoA ligase [Actinomycetia bacterium]|nr:long-chain fatty acid--CoA ligase [Actinomycetes bacterium]
MNLAESPSSHPGQHPALVTPSGSLTYAQIEDRVAKWRGALGATGLGAGDRIMVLSGNDEVFVMAYLAIIGIGAIAVPLNPQSPPAELSREIEVVAPSAAIINPAFGASLDTTTSPHILAIDTLDAGEPAPLVSVSADAPAVLLFTSGTAGQPKPAVLTHGNLDSAIRAMLTLPIDLLDADHVVLGVIPLFHVFGLSIVLNLGLRIGATIVLEDFRSPGQIGALAAQHKVTMLGGPPNLWLALARSADTNPEQFESLELAISGAAKLPPAIHLEVSHQLNIALAEGYGLTETSAVVATAAGSDAPVGSVGRLLPGIEARIVDLDGDDAFVGDPGELWVRGPMVSPGYFEAGEIVPTADKDGWLQTGDLAVVDDDGCIAIVDRLKDLVIVSGFNVYPGEVEAVLVAYPSVAEAAVTGEPDPMTGEHLIAHLVPELGATIDIDGLLAHCREQLARYKIPGRVEVRETLPTGLGGKIRRHEL